MTKFIPLLGYWLYSVLVIVLLYWGPLIYTDLDWTLASYMLSILVFFSFGYMRGIKIDRWNTCDLIKADVNRSLLSGVIFLFTAILFFQFINVLINVDIYNINSIGGVYNNFYDGYVRGQASINYEYVLNIFKDYFSLIAELMVLSSFYKLSKWVKVLIGVDFILLILSDVAVTGKLEILGYSIIFVATLLYIKLMSTGAIKRPFFWINSVIVGVSILVLFGGILVTRYDGIGVDINNYNEAQMDLVNINMNSWFFNVFSDRVMLAFAVVVFYLTNGMYGLYLTMQLPFEWTFFVGNSYSVSRMVEIISGAEIISKTYPLRAGDVYAYGLEKWHTMFAWFASDVTFYGVWFVMYLYGYVYSIIYSILRVGYRGWYTAIFMYLNLGLVFSLLNNQLFHSMRNTLVFATLMIIFLLKLKKCC